MSTIQNYNYIVAEDEPLIRKNIIKKIDSLSLPLTKVGEADNGLDAIRLVDQLLPSFVITDINMPQCDGLEVAKHIFIHHPNMKTIILSGYSEFSFAQKALKYNVCDYILKPVKAETLKETIRQILISLESKNQEMISIQAKTEELSQDEIIEIMIQFFKTNYKAEVNLNLLAKNLGFSQEYLGKIFKKKLGHSPLKYLTLLRMNEAKHLLLQYGELEVGKIGEMVGYRDAFYFSRAFKTHVGMSPSEFRSLKL